MPVASAPVKSAASVALPRILTVAGSDSSGGAGIQADLKTILALGGYGMSAITAITVQNTLGVTDILAVPPATIVAQVEAVLGDIGADAIKTGMLGGVEAIEAVAETLMGHAGPVRVIDPVMMAKGGHALMPERALGAFKSLMVPRAGLLTPNAPEAEVLTGKTVDGENGQRRAGEALLRQGASAVLIKGGHLSGAEVVDWLMSGAGEWRLARPRLMTNHTHGTGCTLASACATLLAKGSGKPDHKTPDLIDCIATAVDYVHGAIGNAPGLGQGHGPLHHGWQDKRIDERAFRSD